MSILMRAAKDFRGRRGEGRDTTTRLVDGGDEFRTDEARAGYLERMGLASRVVTIAPRPAQVVHAQPSLANEAADAGPLADRAGGETGAAPAPSSSPAAPAQRKRRSRPSAAALTS